MINGANRTLLEKPENIDVKCHDIQLFYNFLTFASESLLKIQAITTRDLSAHVELKMNFNYLRIKKEKILQHIIKHQKEVRTDQPIHYYDLYLLIVNQNSTKDIAKDMEFVYLHIHEKKAYNIAESYIYDN